jgi:hypothetical protein
VNVQRGFIDTLKDIREGELLAELPEKLRQLVEAVKATGKKGRLQLTLDVSQADAGMLIVNDDVKLSLPQPTKNTKTVFFVTENSELTRRDPRQPSLPDPGPGRVVSMTAAPAAARGDS